MFNILELTRDSVMRQIEKTKKKQNKLVDAFCSFLYSGEEDTDRYYVGNSEIGGVFCVGDSYFNVSDIELYMKLDTPEKVWKCYRDFTDYKSEDGLLNLAHYIDIVFIGEADEEEEYDCLCEDCDCGDTEVFIHDKELKKELKDESVWVNAFIKDLHTGEELYSRRQGEYVEGENCFIDDTLHYVRTGGEEGVDYEFVDKPVEECIQWGTYGPEGTWKMEYKFISDLETKHIERILETQNLKQSLKKVFELCLLRRKLNYLSSIS